MFYWVNVAVLLNLSVFQYVASYKPVVIIHGVLDVASSMDFLASYIRKAHPGTEVHVLAAYDGYESLRPLWQQVQKFGQLLSAIMNKSSDGIHLVGYSQGGLIARGVLSTQQHNIHSMISLSSPQMGQYGDTDYIHILFPNYVKANLYKFFYSRLGQKVSIGNFWRDPHHMDLYRNYSAYLAVLNNETSNPLSNEFKQNFVLLKQLVLIGGQDDGVITPWQSSHFGFYDANEQIVEFKNQSIYQLDSFGLQTLFKRGCLLTHSVAGVKHLDWHKNSTVIERYILPYLT